MGSSATGRKRRGSDPGSRRISLSDFLSFNPFSLGGDKVEVAAGGYACSPPAPQATPMDDQGVVPEQVGLDRYLVEAVAIGGGIDPCQECSWSMWHDAPRARRAHRAATGVLWRAQRRVSRCLGYVNPDQDACSAGDLAPRGLQPRASRARRCSGHWSR